MKLRIGILTQYYPPETGAPQARLSHLAERFAAHGHDVIVLTAMPSYPRGRVFDGYGGWRSREVRAGVSVIRCWVIPSQSVRTLRRLTSYFSFVFSSTVIGAASLPRLDYLITESPPLFLGIAGYLLSRKTRARWIFNVSDLWPDSAVRLGAVREGWALEAAEALESFCYRRAWLVTGQSAEILENIRRRFPSVALYHLSNGVDAELFRPERRSDAARARLLDGGAPERACLALYAGLHGIAQGLDQILEAAARVRDVTALRFVLVGEGPEKASLLARARALGLSSLRFLPGLPREEMPAIVASADVALVPLRMALPGAVPSKIYEAMGAGVPILLVADGEAARIVNEAGAGETVSPGDVDAMAAALRRMAGDPDRRARQGRSGREAAVRDFDRGRIADRFLEHLRRAAC